MASLLLLTLRLYVPASISLARDSQDQVNDTCETQTFAPPVQKKSGFSLLQRRATIRATDTDHHLKRRIATNQTSNLALVHSEGEHVDMFTGGYVDLIFNRTLDDHEIRCKASPHEKFGKGRFHVKIRAERVGPKAVRCRFDALAKNFVEEPGPMLLQVHDSTRISVNYGSLFSASFDQRPYFEVTDGELLVKTDLYGRSEPVLITALVHHKGREVQLLHTQVDPRERSVHPVNFGNLSQSLDVRAKIRLTDMKGKLLGERETRLTRVPQSRRGSTAVDFKRRALLVDGRPFFPISWFSTYLSFGLDKTLASLRDIAREGANSVMLYNIVDSEPPRFVARSTPVATRVLDYAATLGIKVHIYLVDIVDPLAQGKSQDYRKLDDVIHSLREHPAILSWYVADDSSGPRLQSVYEHIKQLDPYHLVSVALLSPRDVEKYLFSADVHMIENYEQDTGQAFTKMAPFGHGALEFLPAIHCGRAWADKEDEASWSPQVFRNQLYNALLAGATGEVWFAYRNADGWNEPGIPIRDAAGSVARELLDLVPSLLSTNGFVRGRPTPVEMPSISVLGRHQNGKENHGDVRARIFEEEHGCNSLLVVNSLNEPMEAEMHFVPELLDKNEMFTVPFEKNHGRARVAYLRNGVLKEWLPSFGVQVFRYGCNEIEDHSSDLLQIRSPSANMVLNPSFETSHAYVAAPDSWDCRMAPMEIGESDSTCFADTHIAHHGRHAGRFATGLNTYIFRVRPTLKKKTSGHFRGSIWAQAEAPMTLLAVQLGKEKTIDGLADDEPLVQEKEVARLDLTSNWERLDFEIDLCEDCSLGFKVTNPGVFWLDEAELLLSGPPRSDSVSFAEWDPEKD